MTAINLILLTTKALPTLQDHERIPLGAWNFFISNEMNGCWWHLASHSLISQEPVPCCWLVSHLWLRGRNKQRLSATHKNPSTSVEGRAVWWSQGACTGCSPRLAPQPSPVLPSSLHAATLLMFAKRLWKLTSSCHFDVKCPLQVPYVLALGFQLLVHFGSMLGAVVHLAEVKWVSGKGFGMTPASGSHEDLCFLATKMWGALGAMTSTALTFTTTDCSYEPKRTSLL